MLEIRSEMSIDCARAREILDDCGVGYTAFFHTLRSAQVAKILDYADSYGYRKPEHTGGSRGLYFCAHLQRRARTGLPHRERGNQKEGNTNGL